MAITYNAGTNTITVTGYTEVTPCTFLDFFNADVAGGWGVVTRLCNDFFCFSCHLTIGDDLTTTWFKDTLKTAIFTAASCKFYVKTLATFQLGEKDVNGNVYDGCFLKINDPIFSAFSTGGSAGDVKFYDSIIYFPAFWRLYRGSAQLVELIDCRIIKWKGGRIQGTNSIIKGLQFHDATEYSLTTKAPIGTIENIKTYRNTYGIYYSPAYSHDTIIKGVVGKNNTYFIRNESGTGAAYNLYLINAISDAWTFSYNPAGLGYSRVYRQYEFDLKVQDKDETAINGVTVKIWDKGDNLITDVTTGADGKIATQTLNYAWYNRINGDTPTMQTPHIIEISKPGYETYQKKFTIKKTDWTIALHRPKHTSNRVFKVHGIPEVTQA